MHSRITAFFFLIFVAFGFTSCKGPTIYIPTPTGLPQNAANSIPDDPASTPVPSILEKRLILLKWPQKMREKDSAFIDLVIKMDPQGKLTATGSAAGQPAENIPLNIPDLYATHNIVAVARLDLAGVEAFREEIQEPLLPGRETAFRWSIRASEVGTYRGVVWLHLDLVPKNGGPYERVLILARPIEIETVTVFGLAGNLARGLGIVGLFLSSILGYPFIQDGLKSWIKKRGSPRPQVHAQPGKEEKERRRSPE
jgi:hypothetical protein